MSWALVVMGLLVSLLAAGCWFGGDDDEPEPTPAAPSASPSATSTPEPTATPNVLATPPANQSDALRWLQAALSASNFTPPCPQSLSQYGVGCAQGDVDGDARPDLAYLVPLKSSSSAAPYPASVFIRRAATLTLEHLGSDADASAIGASVFAAVDRTGDANGDLTFLENRCSATGCKTAAIVFTWDGTAWRNVGPGSEPIGNVDSVKWHGEGAASKLVVHGGNAPAETLRDAGPTRATTVTYAFSGGRYVVESEDPDSPEYLYHAVMDADRVFEDDKAAALAAFSEVATDTMLKDWRPPGAVDKDRRPALQGYALFRVALAHAVMQSDPQELTRALDETINHGVKAEELLFVRVAEEFRIGYANGGLASGCASVLAYINKVVPGTDTKRYIADAFYYGYENPPGATWIPKICPF